MRRGRGLPQPGHHLTIAGAADVQTVPPCSHASLQPFIGRSHCAQPRPLDPPAAGVATAGVEEHLAVGLVIQPPRRALRGLGAQHLAGKGGVECFGETIGAPAWESVGKVVSDAAGAVCAAASVGARAIASTGCERGGGLEVDIGFSSMSR